MRAKKPIRPIWTTTVDPSEYDYIAHFTRTVKWSNSYNVQCPPTDVGRLWGLVASHQRLERENAALREALAFYAEKKHISTVTGPFVNSDTHCFAPDGAVFEHGARARAAIDAARFDNHDEGGAL